MNTVQVDHMDVKESSGLTNPSCEHSYDHHDEPPFEDLTCKLVDLYNTIPSNNIGDGCLDLSSWWRFLEERKVNNANSSIIEPASAADKIGDYQNLDEAKESRRRKASSIYQGVSKHGSIGRYEAYLWDRSCIPEGHTHKGRQIHLGSFDKEEKAARAYDLAALKFRGPSTITNFPISNYEKELEEMKDVPRQEYCNSLRRKSTGFSRGASIYRGVTRGTHGKWQARMVRGVIADKALYLGKFNSEEAAAEAYDIGVIKSRGCNGVTNFDKSRYDIQNIINSPLPISKRAKHIKKETTTVNEAIIGEATAVDLSVGYENIEYDNWMEPVFRLSSSLN